MAYALIASDSESSGDANTVTTTAINSTDADLLVVVQSFAGVGTPTLTDSNSNTWTHRTIYRDGISITSVRISYCRGGTVGAGHTFTCTLGSTYPTVTVFAFSGAHASPYESENGSGGDTSTRQVGSVTPSADNALVIAALCTNGGTAISADGGFTTVHTAYGAGMGGAGSYLIQTTAAAANPTFSWGGSTIANSAAIAVFLAAGGGGGSPAAGRSLTTQTFMSMRR